jgi:hypothetical protein
MRHLQLVRDETQSEPYQVTATPDWPPVAIPGRPGWWRHYIDGQQVDLPHNDSTAPTNQEGPSRG